MQTQGFQFSVFNAYINRKLRYIEICEYFFDFIQCLLSDFNDLLEGYAGYSFIASVFSLRINFRQFKIELLF
jgi:hypothetical protein